MSGWDSPTGSWDPGPQPEGSGSYDQGYQQSQPTGGHRTIRGNEGVLRAGRRALPGYDQAQNYDQFSGYDQSSGHDQSSGYDQGSGYGPVRAYGSQPGYRADPRDPLGTSPQPPIASGPQTTPAP